MASTSLAEQLKRLAAPQSSIYQEVKKKASLLFDPKEAALKDRDTFYEIGLSGLHELIALYEGFRFYEDSLFSLTSKDFERAVQSKEVNQNLDQTIEKFLLQLSPYFLLQSSHKALEWLVNRYNIHQYNQNEIMALILPYHGSKIFVRFIQIMDIKSAPKWDWLLPIQKNGVALGNQVWYNQCVSSSASLKFIATATLKYVKEFGERSSQLNTVFTFFCQTALGVLQNSNRVKESTINILLPTLLKAIESPVLDFRSSAYIVLGFLFTKATLKADTLNNIIDKLFITDNMTYDIVILITLVYNTQNHLTKMPDSILYNFSPDTMNTLCGFLKKCIEHKQNVMPLTLAFLSSVLPLIQSDTDAFRVFSSLPMILFEEIDFKKQNPHIVIKCVLNSYESKQNNEIPEGDESDIEIIDEEDDFSSKLLLWFSTLLKDLETKYPDAFDKVIKQEMSSLESSSKRKFQLSKVLGFKPDVAHKLGGTYLFENLNHINSDLRVEAVKYICKEFSTLKIENIDFLRESIISRLNDDSVNVVTAALNIQKEYLNEALNEIDVTNILVHILSNTSPKWKDVITLAIKKFCDLDVLPVNQETIFALLPYLFSHDETSLKQAWKIVSSRWGHKFQFTKKLGEELKKYRDNGEVFNQLIFNSLFNDRIINFDEILDVNQLNRNNTFSVYTFILLKASYFNDQSVEELKATLNLLLESVDENGRVIVASRQNESFSHKTMQEYIELSKHNKILFEALEYIFSKLIEDMNVKISKPWCNVCENAETILVRRLYEICITGCAIPTYEGNYVRLLHKLLHKFCKNSKESCEFIANFACGHILYASDPADVINPVLQLRSLKLLNNFFSIKDVNWLYDSDVIILMILFNLNNPTSAIRQCTLDSIASILKFKPDDKNMYGQLLTELLEHKEALLLDYKQISHVLNTIILSQATPAKKIFKKNCLLKFTNILTSDTPPHVTSNFVNLLQNINNASTFSMIVLALKTQEKFLIDNQLNTKLSFNVYESNLFRNVYKLIYESTVSTFTKEQVWSSIEVGLKEYRNCILDEGQTFSSPCVLIMKQLNEEVFKKMPKEKTESLVRLITSAGAFSNNPTISSAAAKAMKRFHFNLADFKPILNDMINVDDPAVNLPKKKKSSISMLSHQLTETNEWRLGVTLLEYIQNKKKMTVDSTFVSVLFEILNKCLRFEEQSYVEYTKQLVLSSLWYYCKKLQNNDKEQIKALKSHFKVELVVQCIRGTQNPQTHHHALILLSHAAYMLPEQVLHHTMEIFTFMGSSVLRHDDAYSFQIIIKIIENLIPILIKMDKNIDEYTEKEKQQLKNRIVPVLRIFADAVLHVPEHRRLPLYKKLMETIGPSHYLWVFIALLLETHITHFNDEKKKDKRDNRTLADQESPMNRLDFGHNLLLEFPPEVCLDNLIKLMVYIKSLPVQKDENAMNTDIDPSDIFSVNGHTAVQLRQYKYVLITFMSTYLASSQFVEHCNQCTEHQIMEGHYKTYLINILTFIQSITKVKDEKNAKYWRVMLHHSYDLLDHTNNLLSPPMFLSVVRGLMKHALHAVRRKSMELLNSKIQHSPEMFDNVSLELIFSLLPVLLDIIKTIESTEDNVSESTAQELELNQQTALLSLKLMTRIFASENPDPFMPALETITLYTCDQNISGNVMASIVLCLAELCCNLKARSLANIRKFMPALLKVLKKQRKAKTPELILLSTVTALSKIIESLPSFLSPYLQKILYEYAVLLAKWQSFDQDCSKVSAIIAKLGNIKNKIAISIPPRVLIPVANETYNNLLEKEKFEAIGPVMSVLGDSFANVTTADFTALTHYLTEFFLSALQLRSTASEKEVDPDTVDKAEDEVVNALVRLILKLSESSFRPFYFKIYDWAIRNTASVQYKDRAITFYRLSCAIANQLKGLFVLFADHFIKNAADLLDSCNQSKSDDLYFESEEKCMVLIKYIVNTLSTVFLYDSQNFLSKEKFETLMQPLVDQLENTLGGIESLKVRATELLIPCISQFAVATADDSLWKLLNYQILLKTRHNDADIRLIALECLVTMATQLGSNWLPLLAESVPFLAELLEDGDQKIETSTKEAIRKLEQILGEPLEKYF